MKKLLLSIMFILLTITAFSQNKPVMYFCERYDAKLGEINVGTIFYPGYFTVMIKSDNVISDISEVTIQIDMYHIETDTYSYYKSVPFEIPKSKYIYFSDKRLVINDIGIYRVWLLDYDNKGICMAILQISN